MDVREPVFAYQGWYPLEEQACKNALNEYLQTNTQLPVVKLAGIVPHAGWIFSGSIAGKTFAALREARPELVFLFGGHMHPHQRCTCMSKGAFGTPLGPVQVKESIASELIADFDCVAETTEQCQPDNTIELQMPFLRMLWPEAKVVAVQLPPGEIAVQMGIWAAKKATERQLRVLALGSTDLTHYGLQYGFTPKGSGEQAHLWSKEENDRPFIDRLLDLDAQGALEHAMSNQSACCPGAAVAAMSFARFQGASKGILIDHKTSYEIEASGIPHMWVGYASIVY